MRPETTPMLQQQIGQLRDETGLPYQLCYSLAGEVRQLMSSDQYQEADQCLKSITHAYAHARTNRLRLAIENAFLFRLGDFIFCSRKREQLLQIVPRVLREKMIQQVVASGI